LAKTNYNQAKRQKENARKARQQEKLAKKLARVTGDPESPDGTDAPAEPGTAVPEALTVNPVTKDAS
jgi:outer membrane protein TolC